MKAEAFLVLRVSRQRHTVGSICFVNTHDLKSLVSPMNPSPLVISRHLHMNTMILELLSIDGF